MIDNFHFDEERNALILGDDNFGLIMSNDKLSIVIDGVEQNFDDAFNQALNAEYKPVIKAEWIKIGKWITERWGCSNCKRMPLEHDTYFKPTFEYCPHCGAEMTNPRKVDNGA